MRNTFARVRATVDHHPVSAFFNPKGLRKVARNQKSGDFIARDTRVPAIDALNARLDEAWRVACDGETLEELVAESGGAPLLVAGDGHVPDEHRARV